MTTRTLSTPPKGLTAWVGVVSALASIGVALCAWAASPLAYVQRLDRVEWEQRQTASSLSEHLKSPGTPQTVDRLDRIDRALTITQTDVAWIKAELLRRRERGR